jgi:hypothetical protein
MREIDQLHEVFALTKTHLSETLIIARTQSVTTHTEAPQDDALAARSSLYAEFRAERDEILKHKWIESEKAGRDIGFERALIDWTRHHRARWRAQRRTKA